MARAALTVTPISKTGIAPTAETTGDATNNHSVANDGRTFLLVRNSNGAATARILTIRLSGSVDGQAITSRTYSIAAGASLYVGPFNTTNYGTTMLVDVAHADLKLSAYRI